MIREIKKEEIPLLTDFIYEAIFQRDTEHLVPRTIIQEPSIFIYIDQFGTQLMSEMLRLLKEKGYKKTSLAVQKDNYAYKMYQKVGFQILEELEEEYLMICHL